MSVSAGFDDAADPLTERDLKLLDGHVGVLDSVAKQSRDGHVLIATGSRTIDDTPSR